MMQEELLELLPYLTKQERVEMDRLLTMEAKAKPWREIARPNQLAPPGNWQIWLLLAGRGFGKTRTIVEWAQEKAMAGRTRGNIVASTSSDGRDVLVDGPSGFLAVCDPVPEWEPSKRRLTWANGSTATLFSAEEPARLRGPQCHWAIADELAAWVYPEAWDHLLFGLRLGVNPQVAVATTPRPTALIKSLIKDPTAHVTRGSTYDNRANLAKQFIDNVISRYEGTRMGRQELNAEILDDAPGAMWKRDQIDKNRLADGPKSYRRLLVAIDPAASSKATSDEHGIIVVGESYSGHYFVLADPSLRGTPREWAIAAIAAYNTHKADAIVIEVNQGGEMAVSTLQTVDKHVPIVTVHASRGKEIRAEPVASLYQQGKVHHVGFFPELEDQMCSWEPGIGASPDRVDALVWGIVELMSGPGQVEYAPSIWG